ncbi:MAG TPA: hypothetical protein VEI24_00515 [Nitrospiria bacterium]|nr:hypothetical protein [Nitrospiria bacterium]
MKRLKHLLLAVMLAFNGCAWTSHQLIAPEGYDLHRRLNSMLQCQAEASKAVNSGAAPLDDQAKAPLKKRATQRFLDRGQPVLDQEGNPAPWRSPFRIYVSSDLSDRYVLCLIGRGYRWDDDLPPPLLLVPPGGVSSAPPASTP